MSNNSKFEAAISTISARLENAIGPEGNNRSRLVKTKVDGLREAVRALEKSRLNKSPSITKDKHFSDISMLSNQLGARVKKLRNELINIQQTNLESIEAEIKERLGLKENSYAAELRSAFRQMNEKQRAELTINFIKDRRSEDLAAILNAPAELSGLTSDGVKRLRTQYEESYAGELLRERDLFVETVASAHVAFNAGDNAALAYTDPARLRQIDEAEQASREAASKFKDSLQDGV